MAIREEAEGPAAESPADSELPPLPWHLVNLWWSFPKTKDFESFDLDFHLSRNVEPSELHLYIAPVGLGEINGVKFYGGIQTNVGGYVVSELSPQMPSYYKGKGAIFSRWGEKINAGFVRTAANGLTECAGYEGDFASGRRPYAWQAGSYTFSLRKADYEKDSEGLDWTWVSAFVTDKATGNFTYISSLKFPGKVLEFWGRHSAFIEIYGGGQAIVVNKLPKVEVRFGPPRINGEVSGIESLMVVYPAGTSVGASPPLMTAELSSDGGEVVCSLHSEFVQRDSLTATLLP